MLDEAAVNFTRTTDLESDLEDYGNDEDHRDE